jgi:hypothetical protein
MAFVDMTEEQEDATDDEDAYFEAPEMDSSQTPDVPAVDLA